MKVWNQPDAVADIDAAEFESSDEENHIDLALRYSHYVGRSMSVGGCAACGLLRENFPRSSDLFQPERISWGCA